MQFPFWRGTLVDVAKPDFKPDGTKDGSEREAGFAVPGGGLRDAGGGEQIGGALRYGLERPSSTGVVRGMD